MFNSKLKKQIKALEDRTWQLENPAEYKVGDKIKEWIVTKVIFRDAYFGFIMYEPRGYKYTLTNIKTGETKTI